MARSTYVYVVAGAVPVAAFTVKHELVTWLRRHPESEFMRLWRMADNPSDGIPGYLDACPPQLPVELSVSELLS